MLPASWGGISLVDDSFEFSMLAERWRHRSGLSASDVKAIQALPWTRRNFGRDAYLVREGEPATVCMLLIDGYAFRQKLVSDGARQIISIHIPGEFIDLQNGFLDLSDHNVQSLGSCTVAIVPKALLVALIAENPAIRRAVWLDLLIDSSVFREWVVNVGRRDARARIAHLLCELIARLRNANICCGPIYDFPMTQEQLADATGLTAVHTNRTLQGLRKEGLITLSANRLCVLDWQKLAQVGDFNERYLHHRVARATTGEQASPSLVPLPGCSSLGGSQGTRAYSRALQHRTINRKFAFTAHLPACIRHALRHNSLCRGRGFSQ